MAVETRNVMGIEVELDPEVIDDWDVTRALMQLAKLEGKKNLTDHDTISMVESLDSVIHVVFGKNFDKYTKKLRMANGGKLPTALVWSFVSETITAFRKN